MVMIHVMIVVMLIVTVHCALSSAQEESFPQYPGLVPSIIVFGDSTVDVGNNNFFPTIARANFRPYGRDYDFGTGEPTGRFCNGRLTIDFIASKLGLPFTPAYLDPQSKGEKLVKGINFASSASGWLDDTGKALNVKTLTQQLQLFEEYKPKLVEVVGRANASSIISKALYVVSTGSNDILDYYVNPILQEQQSETEYSNRIHEAYNSFVQKLYEAGARRIVVTNLPPLGCLPSEITIFGKGDFKHCVEFENSAAITFNAIIANTLHSLKASLPGLNLILLDTNTILSDASKNPFKYGFKTSTRGCCGLGRLAASIFCNPLSLGTCKNATEYVFWDSFHPTDRMNAFIANSLLQEGVPQLDFTIA